MQISGEEIMLKLLEIELELPLNEKINSFMGSVMHGVLMEIISSNVAARLHEENLRPFSQCVYFDSEKNKSIWRIGTLNAEAYDSIILPLLERKIIFVKQKDYKIKLKDHRVLLDTSYENLADEIFPTSEIPLRADFQFLTATSFKRDGGYVIFPENFLVLQSLLQRWNTFSLKMKIEENNLAEKLSTFCKISRYNLHSQKFSLEQKYITGFAGKISISFVGNETVNKIVGLLAKFAPFAGIGIKTALGMGAVSSEIFFRRDLI